MNFSSESGVEGLAVYFFQAGGEGGPVKIGFARNPTRRLKQLQCAHYEALRVIRCVTGGHVVEGWLRERFRHCHLRGEWHRFDPEMLTVDVRDAERAHTQARLERARAVARERGRRKSRTWQPREPGLAGYGGDTRRSYDKAWRVFCAWRGTDAMPVGDDEILRYLAEVLEVRSARSVGNTLAGLSTVHALRGGDRLTLRPPVRAWLKEWRKRQREADNG